jgi:hypothetical protein
VVSGNLANKPQNRQLDNKRAGARVRSLGSSADVEGIWVWNGPWGPTTALMVLAGDDAEALAERIGSSACTALMHVSASATGVVSSSCARKSAIQGCGQWQPCDPQRQLPTTAVQQHAHCGEVVGALSTIPVRFTNRSSAW